NVEHQLRLLFERFRNAGRSIDKRYFGVVFDSFLDSLLDVAHALEVSRNFRAIRRTNLLLQLSNFLEQRIENAALLLHPRAARGWIGVFTEQTFESGARRLLHR